MAGKPKPTPERRCKNCNKKMYRKRFSGRLEDFGAFMRRVYCNQTCMAEGYVSDTPSQQQLMKRARKFLTNQCASCGTSQNLQSHHIDQNRANNCVENIQTLCISCHAVHHHHARRVGKTVAGRMECRGLPPEYLTESLNLKPSEIP